MLDSYHEKLSKNRKHDYSKLIKLKKMENKKIVFFFFLEFKDIFKSTFMILYSLIDLNSPLNTLIKMLLSLIEIL